MRPCNIRQQVAFRGPEAWKIAMPKRTVGRHRDTIFLAPRKDRMFNGPLLQAVEHLIASTHDVFVGRFQIFEIKYVEVADAPGQYLAVTLQALKCRYGLLKRMWA